MLRSPILHVSLLLSFKKRVWDIDAGHELLENYPSLCNENVCCLLSQPLSHLFANQHGKTYRIARVIGLRSSVMLDCIRSLWCNEVSNKQLNWGKRIIRLRGKYGSERWGIRAKEIKAPNSTLNYLHYRCITVSSPNSAYSLNHLSHHTI